MRYCLLGSATSGLSLILLLLFPYRRNLSVIVGKKRGYGSTVAPFWSVTELASPSCSMAIAKRIASSRYANMPISSWLRVTMCHSPAEVTITIIHPVLTLVSNYVVNDFT